MIIWLGEADEQTDLGVRATDAIASTAASLESRRGWKQDRAFQIDWPTFNWRMTELNVSLPPLKVSYEAMSSIFRRPWFDRVWVFQELCMADNVEVVIGPYRLFWGSLIAADDVLLSIRAVAGPSSRASARARLMDSWRAEIHQGKEIELFKLLQYAHGCQSTDPRDKVFAVLGLMTNPGFHFVPDYNLTVADVYRKVVLEYIRLYQNLDIFSCAWLNTFDNEADLPFWLARTRDRELPSWAPDWRIMTDGILTLDPANFEASGQSKVQFRVENDGRTLHLRGKILDAVSDLSIGSLLVQSQVEDVRSKKIITAEVFHDQIEGEQRILENWVYFVQEKLNRPLYYTGESLDDAIWMTMIGGGMSLGVHDPLKITEYHRREARLWIRRTIMKKHGIETLHHSTLIEDLGDSSDSEEESERVNWAYYASLVAYVAVTTKMKRLFLTKGDYLGMGPLTMEEGDLVCLLLGGKTPFVLRPENGHYLLVGQCYVHGIMDGSAIADVKETDMQELELW